MPTESEDFWRKTINEMSTSVPDDGDDPPELEKIRKSKSEGNKKVLVHKVITHIYVFTDIDGKMYTANTAQKMQILGSMTLSRALKLAQQDDLT